MSRGSSAAQPDRCSGRRGCPSWGAVVGCSQAQQLCPAVRRGAGFRHFLLLPSSTAANRVAGIGTLADVCGMRKRKRKRMRMRKPKRMQMRRGPAADTGWLMVRGWRPRRGRPGRRRLAPGATPGLRQRRVEAASPGRSARPGGKCVCARPPDYRSGLPARRRCLPEFDHQASWAGQVVDRVAGGARRSQLETRRVAAGGSDRTDRPGALERGGDRRIYGGPR